MRSASFNRGVGILFFLPALLYMALIFYLSSRPAPEAVEDWPIWFGIKSIHLLEYAGLAALLWFGFHQGTAVASIPTHVMVLLITGLYGVSDEFHQSFNPPRSALVMDAVTDFLGAVLFLIGKALLQRLCHRPVARGDASGTEP